MFTWHFEVKAENIENLLFITGQIEKLERLRTIN